MGALDTVSLAPRSALSICGAEYNEHEPRAPSPMTTAFVNPRDVHPPVGPYSHTAVVPGGTELVFISGQVGMRADGSVPASFAEQADVTLQNLRACLAAHGLGLDAVVKLGVFVL